MNLVFLVKLAVNNADYFGLTTVNFLEQSSFRFCESHIVIQDCGDVTFYFEKCGMQEEHTTDCAEYDRHYNSYSGDLDLPLRFVDQSP